MSVSAPVRRASLLRADVAKLLLLAGSALCATSALPAAPAHASPSWGRAHTISHLAKAHFSAPEVAMWSSGDAVVAWGGPTPEGSDYASLVVSVRTPGGRLAPAQQLSPAGRRVSSFDLAGGSSGEAILVWTDFQGNESTGHVRVAVRPPGAGFGSVRTLSGPGADDAAAAAGPGGTATVVWERSGRIEVTDRLAGGSFGSARSISSPGRSAARPAIVVGPSGEAIVIWAEGSCPPAPVCARGDVVASVRPPGGSFQPPQIVSRSGGSLPMAIGGIELTLDRRGEATSLWDEFIEGGLYSDGSVYTALRPRGGRFDRVTGLGQGGASGAALVADGAGRTIALWGEGTETLPGGDYDPRILSAERTSGAAFGRVRQVERGGEFPNLASAAGRAVAVWSRGERLRAAVRRGRGGYCALSISPRSRQLGVGAVAGDGAGNALAVWGSGSRVLAADGRRGRRRPAVRGFSVRPRRFRVSKRRTSRVALRRGTAFRFRLSEAARVRITIERQVGRRFRRVTSLIRAANAGRHRVSFSGRVGRRRLRRGVYRAHVRASDCDGLTSSRRRPRAVRFRVVR